jgi:hypothetical protein
MWLMGVVSLGCWCLILSDWCLSVVRPMFDSSSYAYDGAPEKCSICEDSWPCVLCLLYVLYIPNRPPNMIQSLSFPIPCSATLSSPFPSPVRSWRATWMIDKTYASKYSTQKFKIAPIIWRRPSSYFRYPSQISVCVCVCVCVVYSPAD